MQACFELNDLLEHFFIDDGVDDGLGALRLRLDRAMGTRIRI